MGNIIVNFFLSMWFAFFTVLKISLGRKSSILVESHSSIFLMVCIFFALFKKRFPSLLQGAKYFFFSFCRRYIVFPIKSRSVNYFKFNFVHGMR